MRSVLGLVSLLVVLAIVALAARQQRARREGPYSHSIVAGGLLEMS